jgi:hypothetical protein
MLHRVALVRTDSVVLRSVRRLLVRANVVSSSLILVTMIMEALSSSETSVVTTATRGLIPEDNIAVRNPRSTRQQTQEGRRILQWKDAHSSSFLLGLLGK